MLTSMVGRSIRVCLRPSLPRIRRFSTLNTHQLCAHVAPRVVAVTMQSRTSNAERRGRPRSSLRVTGNRPHTSRAMPKQSPPRSAALSPNSWWSTPVTVLQAGSWRAWVTSRPWSSRRQLFFPSLDWASNPSFLPRRTRSDEPSPSEARQVGNSYVGGWIKRRSPRRSSVSRRWTLQPSESTSLGVRPQRSRFHSEHPARSWSRSTGRASALVHRAPDTQSERLHRLHELRRRRRRSSDSSTVM